MASCGPRVTLMGGAVNGLPGALFGGLDRSASAALTWAPDDVFKFLTSSAALATAHSIPLAMELYTCTCIHKTRTSSFVRLRKKKDIGVCVHRELAE
jgi:hypothetical protein